MREPADARRSAPRAPVRDPAELRLVALGVVVAGHAGEAQLLALGVLVVRHAGEAQLLALGVLVASGAGEAQLLALGVLGGSVLLGGLLGALVLAHREPPFTLVPELRDDVRRAYAGSQA